MITINDDRINDDRHNPQVIPRNSTNPPGGVPLFSTKPTRKPTSRPTQRRAQNPSAKTSARPTRKPSKQRTRKPSTRPIPRKTSYPTNKSSSNSKSRPSSKPSLYPSWKNSLHSSPTYRPSSRPSHSLCSSSSGDFGVTNGKDSTMVVSYTYELLLKSNNTAGFDPRISASATVADTVASLEVAISNQLIASLFTSCSTLSSSNSAKGRNLQSNTSNVMGLSSSPADIVTYDTCSISTQLDDTSSCHVVLGRLTLFTQDPSLSYSLYSKSLEVIKMSMQNGDLNISPDILRLIYIDNSDDKQILLAVSSLKSSSNVAPIISGVAGFLALLLLVLFVIRRRHRISKTYIFKDNSTHTDNLFYGRDSERLGIDPVEPKAIFHRSSFQQDRLGTDATAVEASDRSRDIVTPEICDDQLLNAADLDFNKGGSVSEARTSEWVGKSATLPYNPPIIIEQFTDQTISPPTFTEMNEENILQPKGEITKSPLLSFLMSVDQELTVVKKANDLHLSASCDIEYSDMDGYIPRTTEEKLTMTFDESDSPLVLKEHDEKNDIIHTEGTPRGPMLPVTISEERIFEENNILVTPRTALVENIQSHAPNYTYSWLNSSKASGRDMISPEWLNHHGTRLRTESNRSDVPLCVFCNMEAHIATTFCHCGNPECKKVAHTACLLGERSPLPSISYPGTPPPSLPPVFCSGRYKRLLVQSLHV